MAEVNNALSLLTYALSTTPHMTMLRKSKKKLKHFASAFEGGTEINAIKNSSI